MRNRMKPGASEMLQTECWDQRRMTGLELIHCGRRKCREEVLGRNNCILSVDIDTSHTKLTSSRLLSNNVKLK
jgi:hypothetical protein